MKYILYRTKSKEILLETENPFQAADYYSKYRDEDEESGTDDYISLDISSPSLFCGDEVELSDLVLAMFVAAVDNDRDYHFIAKRYLLRLAPSGIDITEEENETVKEIAEAILKRELTQTVYYQSGKKKIYADGWNLDICKGSFYDKPEDMQKIDGLYITQEAAEIAALSALKHYPYSSIFVVNNRQQITYHCYNTWDIAG